MFSLPVISYVSMTQVHYQVPSPSAFETLMLRLPAPFGIAERGVSLPKEAHF